MYFIIAILIGLLIGFIRRGSIGAILSHPYNKWYLGLTGIVIQVILHFYYLSNGFSNLIQYFPVVNFISYLLILVMLIFNLDDIYSILIAVGVILNFVVTFINGGYLPVSEQVIASMPLYSQMVQSIYSGTNGVYTLIQPTQTLMSFLGVNIPIPFFAEIVVYTGTVAGLSIGSLLILVGLVGVTQRAMTIKPEIDDVEIPLEVTPLTQIPVEPTPRPVKPQRPYFESKTEELFFEDELLPKNPLDRIFGDEDKVYPTKVLQQITPLQESAAEIDRAAAREETRSFKGLDELTRPIGSDVIKERLGETKPVEKAVKERSTAVFEPIDENEGFFVSRFFAEREKNRKLKNETDRLNTSELFQEEEEARITSDIPVEETQSPVINAETKPVLPEIEEDDFEDKKVLTHPEDLLRELNEFVPESDYIIVEPEEEEETIIEMEDTLPEVKFDTSPLTPIVEEISEETIEPEEETVEEEPKEEEIIETEETTEFSVEDIFIPELDETLPEETEDMKENDLFQTEPIETVETEIEEDRNTNDSNYGIFEEDEQTGYIVTKAYKKEIAKMDKSETEMLNVWSQIARENEELKANRRRQASPNYQTNNPYAEEKARQNKELQAQLEAERQAKEALERKKAYALKQHQQETEQKINLNADKTDMSDEERIAAGYQKVQFEVGGRTIQFWKKDN